MGAEVGMVMAIAANVSANPIGPISPGAPNCLFLKAIFEMMARADESLALTADRAKSRKRNDGNRRIQSSAWLH
jgi:hypothetical protein